MLFVEEHIVISPCVIMISLGGEKVNIDYEVIGKRIKELRKYKGLSREALALSADVSTTFLAHIENGIKKASLTSLIQISNALNVTVNDLLTGIQEVNITDYLVDYQELLADCNKYEKRMILDISKAAKKAIRANSELLKSTYAEEIEKYLMKS